MPHDFLVLSKPERPPGYAGRSGQFAWGDNVLDLPAEAAARAQFYCILFQDDHHYLHDQYRYLTPAQRRLAVIEAMLTGLPIVALATTEWQRSFATTSRVIAAPNPPSSLPTCNGCWMTRSSHADSAKVHDAWRKSASTSRVLPDWQQALAAIASP